MTGDTNATTLLSAPHVAQQHFEQLYLDVRAKEQRVYTDEQVAALPGISVSHPHYVEWQIRKRSADRLVQYLSQKKKPLQILEVGCGNGWLSSMLANVVDAAVTGIDINSQELEQAGRVFRDKANLAFEYGDIRNRTAERKFDIIVFAASIQYFESLPDVIGAALRLLSADGEIHIVDTIFYSKNDVDAARQRSADYYSQMGATGMEGLYFHHTLDDVKHFRHKVMYDPRSLSNKLLQRKDPFYWLSIFP